MITVKLYGLLRIESGIKEKTVQATTVQEVLDCMAAWEIPRTALKACVILVNGRPAGKRTTLNDGDTVVLMSPIAGG